MHFEEQRVPTSFKCAGLKTCRPALLLTGEDKRAQMKSFVLLEAQAAFSGDCFVGDCSNIAAPLSLVGMATCMYCLIKSGGYKDR